MSKMEAQAQLQAQVREIPVISGFSYPFLFLLVLKARELEEAGKLAHPSDDAQGWCDLTGMGAVVLDQIAGQIKGGLDCMSWSVGTRVEVKDIPVLLKTAEAFLNIFHEPL